MPLKEFKPFHSICEFLTAIHIYADEAAQGKVRYVEATHYCSHVRKGKSPEEFDGMSDLTCEIGCADTTLITDLRQCLIYDSHEKDARLIGVEYMVPRHVYETFPAEEQVLWHSHEYEVKSGMLILPKPESSTTEDWEQAELDAMKEIVGLYGKTWHFWQVDAGHQYPLGRPLLMGSVTKANQVDLNEAMAKRNETFGVHHSHKHAARAGIEEPETRPSERLPSCSFCMDKC